MTKNTIRIHAVVSPELSRALFTINDFIDSIFDLSELPIQVVNLLVDILKIDSDQMFTCRAVEGSFLFEPSDCCNDCVSAIVAFNMNTHFGNIGHGSSFHE